MKTNLVIEAKSVSGVQASVIDPQQQTVWQSLSIQPAEK